MAASKPKPKAKPKASKKILPSGLTPEQERFLEEYLTLRELNGAEAARRAGVTHRPKEQAYQWLKLPQVQAALAVYREERAKRVHVDSARVIEELLIIAGSSMEEALEYIRLGDDGLAYFVEGTPEHVARAVKKISSKRQSKSSETEEASAGDIQIEMHDKNQALKCLGLHLGMFTTKVEHSAKTNMLEAIRAAMEANPEG